MFIWDLDNRGLVLSYCGCPDHTPLAFCQMCGTEIVPFIFSRLVGGHLDTFRHGPSNSSQSDAQAQGDPEQWPCPKLNYESGVLF